MIISYHDLTMSKSIGPVDVCIIGSGAGGGTMAYYLARAGYSVVVLEKGGYYPKEELGRKEVWMLTRIEAPTIFTPAGGKHTRVALIAGQCVGGGTVASESVTWDFPKPVMKDWARLGLNSYDYEKNPRLLAWQDELNQRLFVKPVAWHHHNPCNQILAIGAEREGVHWKSSDRPVDFCFRCGNCTQGCHYGVKMDAVNAFLYPAHEQFNTTIVAGAEVQTIKINYSEPGDYPYCEKLKTASGQARDDLMRELASRRKSAPAKFLVSARVIDAKAPALRNKAPDYKHLTVHARNLVMAAGPVGNTRILLKSRINPNSVVGRQFMTQPGASNQGYFPQVEIRGWDGINDSTEVDQFCYVNRDQPGYDPERHGFLLEAASSLPWGMANILNGVGRELVDKMNQMNHWSGIESIIKSDGVGRITEDEIIFDITERDNESLLFATWLTARIFFRAGAKMVQTSLPGLVLKSPSQLDEIWQYRYQGGKAKGFMIKQANLYSGHHFGGAIMGADRKSSFADETGECHDIKGLWVCDGSAFPTNCGVNCAMSIMLVARKNAEHFIEKVKRGESRGA